MPKRSGAARPPRSRELAVLLVMEGLYGVQPGGPDGGVQAENDADGHRHAESQDDRAGRHDRRPAREDANELRQAHAQNDAGHTPGQRNDRRLDEELADDVFLAGTDRAADADLARPFQDAG